MSAFRPPTARAARPGAPPDSSAGMATHLDELERKIERLRAMYESFFMGVDRQAPAAPRRELNRLVLELQQASIRNATVRFRYQSLMQRWTVLTTYWNRTMREIESGTYRRDLLKTFRRMAERSVPLTEGEAVALGIPRSRAQAFVAQQNRRRAVGGPADDAAPAEDKAAKPGP